jgi:GT2 family glycosyltransferase
MKNLPEISFVIVNYNGLKFLSRLLTSVYQQSNPSFEVIFVDNSSIDDSVKFVSKKFPGVKIIRSANIGFGRGCNLGAGSAVGRHLIFMNPDVYLPREFISKNISFYDLKNKLHPGLVGLIAARYIDYQALPSSRPQIAGTKIDIFGTPQRSFINPYLDDTFGIFGACFFINRHLFNHFKGFNPNFFLYGEEIDLSWRLKTHGYHNFTDQQNYFFHFGGGSDFSQNRPRQVALMTFGCLLASYNNYQTLSLIIITPLYFIYLLILIIILPLFHRFNILYSLELIKSLNNFKHTFSNIKKYRQTSQSGRTVTDLQLLKYFSPIPSIILH